MFLSCAIIVFTACKDKEKKITVENQVNNDTIPFYPYLTEIGKEIDSINNNKVALKLAVTDSANKLVKSQIDIVKLKALIAPFLQKDITVKPIKQFYKESVFNDLTTVSTIMNYTTNKDSLPVKSVDVLLNASNTSEIKRLDMKVIYDKSDSVITENYSWIFKKAFYVLRYAQAANGKGVATKINVSWEK
jgi:hypothetical protein